MGEAIILKRRPSVSYAKDWQYTLNDTTALVTKYIGNETNVVVPNKIRGKNVVLQNSPNSSNGVFTNNRNIVSVRFSNGVKFANNNMSFTFSNCKNLISVTAIPSSLSNMYYTFQDCNSITDAPIIPNGVVNITGMLINCCNLVNAPVIPNSVMCMSDTFFGCTNLVNAPVIPNGVTDMTQTFLSCRNLVNAPVIPNSVIGVSGAFRNCHNLVNAPVIPNSVIYMPHTFRDCTNLKGNIYIKSNRINNTSMQLCFYGTTLPKNVYIPSKGLDATNNTWNAAFNATYGINGKNGVTVYDIGDTIAGQWEYTTNATSALITKYIGTKTDVVVPYEIDGKNVVLQNSPNSSNGVFTNNKNITSVRFLTDGTKIANSNASNMFTNCSNLKGVSIMPNGVTNMSNAFLNCQNLSEAPYIPNSVTNVCNAFTYCHNLQGIVAIPPSVTNMAYAFRGSCPNIQLFIEPTALNAATMNCAMYIATEGSDAIGFKMGRPNIYVYNSTPNAPCSTYNYRNCLVIATTGASPVGSKDFYANQIANMDTYTTNYFQVDLGTSGSPSARITDIGSLRSPNLYIPCKITSIYTDKRMSTTIEPRGIRTGYNGPFYEQSTILNVVFGAGVKWVRNNQSGTFVNCTGLQSVKGLPPITSMEAMFVNCCNLVNAPVVPNGVTTMRYAFDNCHNLVNASAIPNGVTNMDSAFRNCHRLINAPAIPNGVTNAESMFGSCYNLVNAPVISNGVTTMASMFENCYNLVNAPVIPNSVTSMLGTFMQCYNLVNAPVIPNSVTNMNFTFYYCNHLSGNVVIKSNSVEYMRNCFDHIWNINVYCPAASGTMSLANTYVKSAGRGNVYDINTYTGTY